MVKNTKHFWEEKTLEEMSTEEWESLCDSCGKCCLEKLRDEETDIIYTTAICCRLLDTKTCKCSLYETRFKYVDDCIKLTPQKIHEISWLPKTCSYRLIKEGKPLPKWHPLITKDKNSTTKSGNGVNKIAVHPALMEKDIFHYIIDKE